MAADEQQRRQVAYKVKINEIVAGKYIKEEGWNPNYVLMDNGLRVSRVNIMAVVVGIPANEGESFQSIVIDDGSAEISVRDFEKNGILNYVNVGDAVLLIGKPREYGGEKYIIPEIIRKIENKKWIEVRKLELEQGAGDVAVVEQPKERVVESKKNVIVEDVEVVEDSDSSEKGVFEKIIECVNNLDKGEGADVSEVLNGVEGATEEKISKLLRDGEIFEVRSGKLKAL